MLSTGFTACSSPQLFIVSSSSSFGLNVSDFEFGLFTCMFRCMSEMYLVNQINQQTIKKNSLKSFSMQMRRILMLMNSVSKRENNYVILGAKSRTGVFPIRWVVLMERWMMRCWYAMDVFNRMSSGRCSMDDFWTMWRVIMEIFIPRRYHLKRQNIFFVK